MAVSVGLAIGLGSALLHQIDRAQTASFHLAKCLLTATGLKLALSNLAVGLERFELKDWHGKSRLRFARAEFVGGVVFHAAEESLILGHAQDFLGRGRAGAHQPPAVFGQ